MSTCYHCKDNLDPDKEIICDLCEKHYHIKCTKLSRGETAILKLKDRSLSYICNKCKSITKTDLIKEIKSLQQTVAELQLQIQELNENRESQTSRQPDIHSTPTADQNVIINEFIEREKRSKNIVLFNIEDKPINEENKNNNIDTKKVKDILKLLDIDIDIGAAKIRRLGKIEENKRRPIKITLSSKEDSLKAVRQKKKLRDLEEKVFVSLDLTPMQRDYYKKIKGELDERKNNGEEDIFIKYMNNIPMIAKKVSTEA